MNIIFCRSNHIPAILIRWFTWSRWNHVAIEIGGEVYESTAKKGVAKTSLTKLMDGNKEVVVLPVAVRDPFLSKAFLDNQVGRPYDYTAILGIFFRRDWAECDSWFCSELVETAILAGGTRRFRGDMQRITPEHLWMVTLP